MGGAIMPATLCDCNSFIKFDDDARKEILIIKCKVCGQTYYYLCHGEVAVHTEKIWNSRKVYKNG